MFAAVFFASESFKLTAAERVKWMGDPKLLWFYSTKACSATPLPSACATSGVLKFVRVRLDFANRAGDLVHVAAPR